MFVLTVKTKIKKPKRFLILCSFAILLLVGILYIAMDSKNSTAYCKGIGEYSLKFSSQGEKDKFFSTFNIKGDLVTIDKVRIPEEFNKTYEGYNKIQKEMGLNLDEFKGKTVKRFVYSTDDKFFVSVLTYRGKVVACHKCTNIYGDKFLSLKED